MRRIADLKEIRKNIRDDDKRKKTSQERRERARNSRNLKAVINKKIWNHLKY
mgnify:CR=1 FL=1